MADRADVYRKRAEECRMRAAAATNPELKQQYEDMANGWLKLARHAEQWTKKMESGD
jgi:hypothetical protein